jgi:hypothetical protein
MANPENSEDWQNGGMDEIHGEDKIMPIAIVGMGCRFPQDATSPENLWDMLLRKQSAQSDVPIERFNVDGFHHPDSDRSGTVSHKSRRNKIELTNAVQLDVQQSWLFPERRHFCI